MEKNDEKETNRSCDGWEEERKEGTMKGKGEKERAVR